MSVKDTTGPTRQPRRSSNGPTLSQEFFRDWVYELWRLVLNWGEYSATKSTWLAVCLSTISLIYLGADYGLSEVPRWLFEFGQHIRDIALKLQNIKTSSGDFLEFPAHVLSPQAGPLILVVLPCWSFVLLVTYFIVRNTELPLNDTSNETIATSVWHRIAVFLWGIFIWGTFDLYLTIGLDALAETWDALEDTKHTLTMLIRVFGPIMLLIGLIGAHVWRPATAGMGRNFQPTREDCPSIENDDASTERDDASTRKGSVLWLRRFLAIFSFPATVFVALAMAAIIAVELFLSQEWSADPTKAESLAPSLQSLPAYLFAAVVYLATAWDRLRHWLEATASLLISISFVTGLLLLVGDYLRDFIFACQPDSCVVQDSSDERNELCAPLKWWWSDAHRATDCPDSYRYTYFFQATAMVYLARQFKEVVHWIVRTDYKIRIAAKAAQARAEEAEGTLGHSHRAVNAALRRISFHASIRKVLNASDGPFEA